VSGRGWQQLLSTIICASFLFVSLPPTYTLSLPETEPIYENIENVGGRLSLSNGALAGYYVSNWIWAAEGSELDWAESEPELTESFESAPSRVENLPDETNGFGLLFEGRPEAEELELFLSGWGENAKLYIWSGGWEFLEGLTENFQKSFQLRPASKYLLGTDVWVKLEGRVELEGARLVCRCTHKSKVFVQISDESGRWFGANGENSYFDSPPVPVEGRFRFRVEIRRDSPSLNPWFEFQELRKGKPKWVAKVDPDLLQALENCPPDNEFFVIIFLKDQPWIPKELKRAELPEKAKYLKETVLPRQEKLLKFLHSKRILVKYRFWLYNAVAAVVPARFIEEVAKLPFVWYVYWDRPLPLEPCDDISVQNVRATDVHTATPENYTGRGVRVGILGSGIKNDVTWLQRGGVSVVVKDFRGDLNAVSTTDVWDIGGANTDDHHETNVACVLAGQAPENIGVAPGVDVYDLVFFDTNGNAYASYLINCVQYAASENVSILSMSYGMTSYISLTNYYIYPYTYRYAQAEIAERAVQLGIFFVNAAGNEGPATASLRSSIAGAEAITTAGGYWDNDTVAPEDDTFYCPAYSNPEFFSRGPGSFGTFKPEIVAPAAKIWVQNADNTFSEVGGTSFAAPHIAGGAALVKQRHPDWGPWEIKMALVNSARRMGDNHPFLQGAGALNCYKAVFNDVLIGVPQWYDYRIPSDGNANIFGPEWQESDNIMGAELALSPTWTVTLPPGENTSTIIYVMNHRSTTLNLSFSYQTFPDIDNSSRPLSATFTVPSPITVPAKASLALPLRLSLAADQYPGTYAAFLEFSDGENTFRVPVSVVVPAILSPGANQLTFTYNHVFGAKDDVDEYDRGGEWHLLPFFISSPADNVTATWTFASGTYDFSLMDSIGREDRYADNHAWATNTSPTSLTLTGVKPGLWWISSHYVSGAGDTYQAKIDLNGSDAVQITSAVFYSPITQTLDLLARVAGIGGGANISSVSFTIYKDNSRHQWSTYPDYNISDISTGLGGSLQNLGSGLWSIRGFDASLLYEDSGPGAYYALITADNGTAKWTGASPLFFVPDVRVKAWALRTGFENVLVYARADCSTHGSIDNTKVRLAPSYAVFEVGPDNLRGTIDDNFQFSGALSWNPQLSRWEAVLDTSSIDENRCYAVVTFIDNWLHCSCGATNLFYASEWVQTDWKGGPTPSLQAGTWMEDYDNFYLGENMDYSGAGSLRLAVENYENLYTYVTSYAAITGAVENFENQQRADDAGAYSTLKEALSTLTIFYDGFESGGFAEGGWQTSSPAPVVSTDHPYQGSYAAGGSVAIFGATTNTYSFAKTLNTSGYNNVTLSYARAVEDAGAGNITFTAEYSTDGGSTWTSLESVTDTNNVYSVVSFSVPSAPQLTIRFSGTFGGLVQANANCFWVDEVRVTGDAYAMEIRENISGIPQAENYFLEIRYALDNANENFRLEVWNGSSWESVMYLSSTAWVENSFQLGPQHVSGSTVMVRFVNATVGGLATNLMIDYLRVRSVVPRFKPAGWLESSAFDSRSVADWGPVRWSAEIPAQTSVRVWIRSSSDAANWGPWCLHENNTENSCLEDDRYVQYRIEFFTDNVYLTPKLYDITIPFRPWWWGSPQAPSLSFPENGTRDSENTPTFGWTGGQGVKRFWLQIDNDSDLSSPVYDNRNILSTQTSCRIENELTVGTYYWRVVAANAFGENSSEVWTYVCIPPYWRTLETWSETSSATACYQSVEAWTANLPATALWSVTDAWTGTVNTLAAWWSLEGWTDTAASPATGWFQLETWQGELVASASWGVLEDLQGTVLAAVAWYEVESCQGGVGTTAGWQFLEGWQGTLSTTAAWWQIESLSGMLQALAGWVGVEGWSGGIGTTANWLTIEFCSGTVVAAASWLQMEDLNAGIQTSALWQSVESWTGTCATAIGWVQLELWQAGTSTTAGWTPIESLQATCAGAVNWWILESWSGALQATAGWNMLESWSCGVVGVTGWITLEGWMAGTEAVASWLEVEGLQGTCSSLSRWQVLDSWTGRGLTTAGWYLLDSIAGQLGSQVCWIQVDICSGLIHAPVSWESLENWEGAISTLAGWSQLEVIQATLGATAGWQSLDSWAGTIGTFAGWVSVDGLSGTVGTSAGWMEIELCTGGIQTLASWLTTEGWGCTVGTLVEWEITDSWTCIVHGQAGWLWLESWSGALTNTPQWAAVDQWTGSVYTSAFWQGVEGWSGIVLGWSAWQTVESWSGEVQAFVQWACLEGWSETVGALASWLEIESWACGIQAPIIGWLEVESWTDNVYAYALPGAPVLLSPENNATVILPLTFTWIRGANADNHRIEIDNNPDFSSPEENVWRLPPDDNWYTTTMLDYGTYYWRVWAVNAYGENCSENVWTFTLVAVWRELESWTGTASSIPPTWSAMDSWTCTASTLPVWSTIESWTGTSASVPPLWLGIDSWSGTASTIPAWSAIDSWICAASSIPPTWFSIDSWTGTTLSIPPAWSSIESWAGTASSVLPAWIAIDSWTCTTATVPTAWTAIEFWTCAASSIPAWSTIESWSCTATSIPTAWSAIDSWAGTTSSIPPVWSAVESWAGTASSVPTAWPTIESWTCTISSVPPAWATIDSWIEITASVRPAWTAMDSWTGTTASLPTAWSTVDAWTCTTASVPPAWSSEESWTCNVSSITPSWSTVESWAGAISSVSPVWSVVDSWTGTISCIPTAWSTIDSWTCATSSVLPVWLTIDSWTGTTSSIAPSWSVIESWTCTASSIPPAWSSIESWTCTTSSIPTAWSAVESWTGTTSSVLSVWLAVESWTGTASSTLPVWLAVDSWSGSIKTLASWIASEGWGGTLHAPAGWVPADSCTGAVQAPSSWSTLEGWVGSIQTSAAWSVIETWAGTALAPGTWVALEGWDETVEALAGWRLLESWQDSISTITEWVSVEGWSSCVQAPATGWQALEVWEETAGAPAGWTPIDSLDGITQAKAWWAYLEGWSGEIRGPAGWLTLERWSGGASSTPPAWLLIESLSCSVEAVAAWMGIESISCIVGATATWRELELWSGSLCTVPGWVGLETVMGSVLTVTAWVLIEEWTGAVRGVAGWETLEGWDGTLSVMGGWCPLEGWQSGVASTATWEFLESWQGALSTVAVWWTLDSWAGATGAPAIGWLSLEGWDGTVLAQVGWQSIEVWSEIVGARADWRTLESCTGTISATAGWLRVDSWTGGVQSIASWQTLEGWMGTVQSPVEWLALETWTGAVAAAASWQILEGWSEAVGTQILWSAIETWTGTVSSHAGWSTVEAWTGATRALAGWWAVEAWLGTTGTTVHWQAIESWAGTLRSAAGWVEIETWAVSMRSSASWSAVEEWSGTAQTTVQWLGVEGWTGTLGAPAQWLGTESWAASVTAAPLGWCEVEGWSSGTRAPALWSAVEAWAGTICARAGWLAVDSCTGTVQTRASWQGLEGWMGTARSAAGWSPIESCTGGVGAPAGWMALESLAGEIRYPASWQTLETWTYTISSAPPTWSTVESWTCTASSIPPTWSIMESWAGTTISIPAWSSIESWTGTTFSPSAWNVVDSWAGGTYSLTAWSAIDLWTCTTASIPPAWSTVDSWTGVTSSISPAWSVMESWTGTATSITPTWSSIESWTEATASTPPVWSTTEAWACTVRSTLTGWLETESWMGSAASPAGWLLTDSWTEDASALAVWMPMDRLAGTAQAWASWVEVEGWTGSILTQVSWLMCEGWAGMIEGPASWVGLEFWAGTIRSQAGWVALDSWTETAGAPAGWNATESWETVGCAPAGWVTVDRLAAGVQTMAFWGLGESLTCSVQAPYAGWLRMEAWACTLPATASWLTLESQAGTGRSPAFWKLEESWDCSSSAPFAGWFEIDRWAGAGTSVTEWLSVERWSGTVQFLAAWSRVEAWTQDVGAVAGWQMVEGYGACLENLAGWFLLELWESVISSMPAMWFRLEQLEGSVSAPPRWTCLDSWLSTANFAAGWTPIDSRAASLSSITFWRTLETGSGEMGSPPAPPALILPENASTTTPTPTFQWGGTSPLDNFRLEVDNDNDFSSPEDNLTFDRNITSWTKPAPGYVPDNYYWRIWAINRFGESCSIVRTFRVLLGPPTQPVLLSPENGSPTWTVVTLAWRRAERADNHRIEISTDPDFGALVENTYLMPPNDNSYTASLNGPGGYYWRVWGVNPLGENCSEVWSFRAYLAAPRLVSPADGFNTNTPPTLNWENLTPVDNFELQVDNDQDFGSPEVRVSLTGTSYTVSLPDGLYHWRVRAFRWGENSPWSSIRTFRIDTVPPSKPTLLFPVNVSTNDNTPLFQWLHVSENSLPVSYWIQIDNDQTFNEPYVFSFGWIFDNKFELPGENSLPDGVYYWRIRARDNAGNLGIWSSASFRVDTQAPPAPVLSAPVGGAWASIRPVLSWRSVQDPSSVQYKVYVCEQPSFSIPYRVYESDWLTENSWQAPVLEEALGLEGKFFYWRVCARDGAGNVGENSPTENFRADNYVAKVTLLSPENGSLVSGTVEFKWYSVTDASGISGYWFQLSTSEEFTYLLENAEVENLYLTSLYLPGDYYWRVCAVDNVGNRGPWSDCFTVRVSGWVGLESWESRPVAGGWWRKIESLQAGTVIEAWRQIESMQGGTAATATWKQAEKVSSSAQTERGWRWLESRFLRALSRVGWISIEVESASLRTPTANWVWIESESTSLRTPTAPAPVMVPMGAWGLLERWEGEALVPSLWLEVDRSAASTLPIVLSISPERASVEQGGTVYAIIRVESRYTNPVRLETDTLPGAAIALSPSEGVPAFQSVLRVEVGASVQVGTYELGIYAHTDGITVRGTFALEVRPPTRFAPFVAAGTSSRFDFSDLRTPINRVEVEAIENVTEPYLIIEFLKQLPPGIPVPELPVYVYARVRTNVPNRSARFSFTVEDSWLRAQEAGAELVCMLRLGERWEEISTRLVGENAEGKTYDVTVPRLSEVTMLAIACRRPVRVPLAVLLGLALGAGIGLGGWFLLHLLRPKPAFRPPREVLERVRRTIELGPAMPPQRVILERYKKAVVYRKKPKFRTVEGVAETSKVKELWEKVSRQVRPEVPRPEERVERLESEKEVTHPKKPTIEKLWERVSQQVRKRGSIKKAVAYKRRPKMVKMAEPREIAEELWRRVSRRIRKK